MIVEFRCDFCGQRIKREDVTALVLIDGAFSIDGEKQKVQLELCPKCAYMLRRKRDTEQESGVMFQKNEERRILPDSQFQKEIFEDGCYTGKGKIIRRTQDI